MKNIAIVGYGYWGKNLVRNFYNLEGCYIEYVCEKNEKNANNCSTIYPNINVVDNFETLLNDQNVDAIVIATPVDTHYQLAKDALLHGKHVLVEKPLTSSYKESKELVEIAIEKNKILMVDHTFLYT